MTECPLDSTGLILPRVINPSPKFRLPHHEKNPFSQNISINDLRELKGCMNHQILQKGRNSRTSRLHKRIKTMPESNFKPLFQEHIRRSFGPRISDHSQLQNKRDINPFSYKFNEEENNGIDEVGKHNRNYSMGSNRPIGSDPDSIDAQLVCWKIPRGDLDEETMVTSLSTEVEEVCNIDVCKDALSEEENIFSSLISCENSHQGIPPTAFSIEDIRRQYLMYELRRYLEVRKKIEGFRQHKLLLNKLVRRGNAPRTKVVMVIDLDKTLIASRNDALFPTELISNTYGIDYTIRPGAELLLKTLHEYCHTIMYSAAEDRYVEDILQSTPQFAQHFDNILTRTHCPILTHVGPMKSLDIIRSSPTFRVKPGQQERPIIILDDKLCCWPQNLNNLLLIQPFQGEKNDTILAHVLTSLLYIIQSPQPLQFLAQLFPFPKYIQQIQNSLNVN